MKTCIILAIFSLAARCDRATPMEERDLGSLSFTTFDTMTTPEQLGGIPEQIFVSCCDKALPGIKKNAEKFKRKHDFELFYMWYYDTFVETDNDDDYLTQHDGKTLSDIRNNTSGSFIDDYLFGSYCDSVNSNIGFNFDEWWAIMNIYVPFIEKRQVDGVEVYFFPDLVLLRRYFNDVLDPKYNITEIVERMSVLDDERYPILDDPDNNLEHHFVGEPAYSRFKDLVRRFSENGILFYIFLITLLAYVWQYSRIIFMLFTIWYPTTIFIITEGCDWLNIAYAVATNYSMSTRIFFSVLAAVMTFFLA